MRTEIYESDPFSPKKGRLLAAIDTDYRFEKQDELVMEQGGQRQRVRVLGVRVELRDGTLSRELLVLPL